MKSYDYNDVEELNAETANLAQDAAQKPQTPINREQVDADEHRSTVENPKSAVQPSESNAETANIAEDRKGPNIERVGTTSTSSPFNIRDQSSSIRVPGSDIQHPLHQTSIPPFHDSNIPSSSPAPSTDPSIQQSSPAVQSSEFEVQGSRFSDGTTCNPQPATCNRPTAATNGRPSQNPSVQIINPKSEIINSSAPVLNTENCTLNTPAEDSPLAPEPSAGGLASPKSDEDGSADQPSSIQDQESINPIIQQSGPAFQSSKFEVQGSKFSNGQPNAESAKTAEDRKGPEVAAPVLNTENCTLNPPAEDPRLATSKPDEGGLAAPKSDEGGSALESSTNHNSPPTSCAGLIDSLAQLLPRFVVLPKHAAETLALWIVHTYCFQFRDVSTYIGVESPEKRCGKTTLLGVLSKLVHRPVVASNISPSAFFRVIEEMQPTLLIDEADTFLQANDELRGILNAGYHKPGAYVIFRDRVMNSDV